MRSKVGWPATVRQITYYFDVNDFLNMFGVEGGDTWSSLTYRDEEVRYLLLITFPCLPILSSASCYIPIGPVDNHDHKEDRVEPGKRASVHEVRK